MFKTWTSGGPDAESVARELETHLNEYAQDVVSVSYAVTDQHWVLAVYRAIEATAMAGEAEAVAVAEHILEESQL